MSGGSSAFACRMCGQCCEGRGGIVVSPTDEARLCRALRLDPPTFRERYTEQRNGKMHLRVGEDGRCLFFRETGGCSVHVHKPAVCRAWPFFKGNLPKSIVLAFPGRSPMPTLLPRGYNTSGTKNCLPMTEERQGPLSSPGRIWKPWRVPFQIPPESVGNRHDAKRVL